MNEYTLFGGQLSPLPSRATRTIARRSQGHSSGCVVVQLPAQSRARVSLFESKLEQRVLFLLLAMPDIVDIWEQPPAMRYVDDQGRSRLHVFDFLVRFASGRRVAVFVKPAKLAAKPRVKAQLAALRA